MNKTKLKTLLVFVSLFFMGLIMANAHDGHDHDAPGAIPAQKGGVIKSLENVHIEVISKGNSIKIFPFTKDLKPVQAKTMHVSATAEIPRPVSTAPIHLEDKGNYWEANFDAKKVHRYTLVLFVQQPGDTVKDRLTFTIEPRK